MKKLLNKKGSVLFLVVVVMAVLLVAASATYYVIRNQSASANTHYSSEQSYQTAYSVSNTMTTFLVNEQTKISKNPALYTGSIFDAMMKMPKGGILGQNTINNFTKEGLGEYNIIIEKTDGTKSDSGEKGVFKITTSAEVNGETTTLVQVWQLTIAPAKTKFYTKFLTSTGYRQEDVYLDVQHLYGAAYFENPYTSAGALNQFRESIYATGTFSDNGMKFNNPDELCDLEVVIADNFYITTAEGTSLIGLGGLFVGGNFLDGGDKGGKQICLYEYEKDSDGKVIKDSNGKPKIVKAGSAYKAGNAYIMGDLTFNSGGHTGNYFVKGDCYINSNLQNTGDINFYIGGDLYLGESSIDTIFLSDATFYVEGNIYICNKGVGTVKNIYRLSSKKDVISDPDAWTVDVIDGTGGVEIVNKEGKKLKYHSVEEIMAATTEFGSWVNVQSYINTSTAKGSYGIWKAENLVPEGDAIALSDPSICEKAGEWDDSCFVTISDSCTIKPGLKWWDGCHYVLIDASEHDIYIKLDGTGYDYFSFGLNTTWEGDGINGPAARVNILIRGSYAVVFVLPDDVDFKMGNESFIGHEDLALALYNRDKANKASSARDLYNAKVNVYSCFEGYPSSVEQKADPSYKPITNIDVLTEEIVKEIEIDEIDEETGENKKIRTIVKGSPYIAEDSDAHNNIFLVSNGKTNTLDFNARQCPFFGYLYAPNTLLGINTMNDGVGFCGGLIVGSYSYISPNSTLIYCDPYEYKGKGKSRGTNIVTELISDANRKLCYCVDCERGNCACGGDCDEIEETDTAVNFGAALLGYM